MLKTNFVQLGFLFSLVVLVLGCSEEYGKDDFVKVESVSSPFFGGLHSYMNKGQVKAYVEKNYDASLDRVSDDNTISDNRPPFRIEVKEVSSVIVEGHSGKLKLSFFNDRLMSAKFYPKHIEAFRLGIKGLSNSEVVHLEPFTKIWLDRDYEGKEYVGWIDTRLEDQFNYWIAEYT